MAEFAASRPPAAMNAVATRAFACFSSVACRRMSGATDRSPKAARARTRTTAGAHITTTYPPSNAHWAGHASSERPTRPSADR